ncbi:Retrovirus-related Pol polyprotein from transposon TNT 1-94 [Gossypium australe]|uniref:Retrovirus-related Pol polyprotein from transposon TNT 1-94 n=1 Tax=Gossypium australe TaxID=47621 RepID=A0A5B6UUN9_9ROSI|nr:Retrovirus-related Pol polyprotein from transposon TNT 1-94 [Gossypium australe]
MLLRQVDINNAFLNGDLSEEINMHQPLGFKQQKDDVSLVCRLKKTLYGLKQSPKAWFHKLKEYLLTTGFILSKYYASLFIKRTRDMVMYVLVYVDGIIITGSSQTSIDGFVQNLDSMFSLKGINVSYTSTGLFLSQRKYIDDLLKNNHIH